MRWHTRQDKGADFRFDTRYPRQLQPTHLDNARSAATR
jgi:hypothetical protein